MEVQAGNIHDTSNLVVVDTLLIVFDRVRDSDIEISAVFRRAPMA
jgi:hypothetical protein